MPIDVTLENVSMGKEADESLMGPGDEDVIHSTFSSAAKYCGEWTILKSEGVENLRKRALRGELRTARLRSIAWRVLLGVLGSNSEKWCEETANAREHYRLLKEKLKINPRIPHTPPTIDNPLSQHDQSSWNQFFCDSELKSVIHQDVVRTFPSLDFFRNNNIQQVMINILFCYARENPVICYRQGMHEVLAPVLFVLSCDHQALLHLQQTNAFDADVSDLVNPDFIEEDGYMLFRHIMNNIAGSYHISNIIPLATGHFPSGPPMQAGAASENYVLAQLETIKKDILAPTDPHLCHHLEQLDIPLQLFAIRWLRLLFGREFPLEDLLVLWDSIFAFDCTFTLVDYIVVSMLFAIRETLITSDYTSCLSQLMRYPGTMDISFIIDYALHLKDPEKYSRPKSSGFSMRKSLPNARRELMEAKQTFNDATTSQRKFLTNKMNNARADPMDGGSIVEGYVLNDPVIMEGELRNAHGLMALCRLKLLQYHSVLESAVRVDDESACQALTGILQICKLLETNGFESVEVGSEVQVEPASPRAVPPQRSPTRPVSLPTRLPSSVDMTVFKPPFLATPTSDLPVEYPYS